MTWTGSTSGQFSYSEVPAGTYQVEIGFFDGTDRRLEQIVDGEVVARSLVAIEDADGDGRASLGRFDVNLRYVEVIRVGPDRGCRVSRHSSVQPSAGTTT